MKQFLLILFVLLSTSLRATNYYVSATGNDTNNGLTPATAWQTIKKVNSFAFAANDNIQFNRGDVFYGSIVVNRNNLFFDAYGMGNLPVITGLVTLNGWTLKSTGIYETDASGVKNSVNLVTLNEIPQEVGRYPNSDAPNGGYLTYSSYSGITSLTSADLIGNNWTNAEVVSKKNPFIIERDIITSQTGGTITYRRGIESINPRNGGSPQPQWPEANGFGLFIQRDPRTLDKLGEWFFDTTKKKIQMFFGVSVPNDFSIKVSTLDTLLNIGSYSNVSITNIKFEGANMAAIYFNGGANITIKNCTINFSGAKGIFGWHTPNSIIDNNILNYCLCSAIDITQRYAAGVTVTNNKINKTATFPGMGSFYDFDAEYKAVYVVVSNTAIIRKNFIDTCGFVGIQFQGNNITIDSNYINYFGLLKSDGGAIYSYGAGEVDTINYGRIIRDNIILNGIDNINGSIHPNNTQGIYLDDQTSGVEIYNNTIAHIRNTGVYFNTPRNVNVHDNQIYDALAWSENKKYHGNSYNFKLKRNVFMNIGSVGLTGNNQIHSNDGLNATTIPTVSTIQESVQLLGAVDSNYYQFKTINTKPFFYYYNSAYGSGSWVFPSPVSLSTWKTFSNLDANSIEVSNSSITTDVFQYNASSSPITYNFPGLSKKDVFGNIYNNNAIIPAFASKILIANGTSSTSNITPIANAGTDKTITLPTNTTNLAGTGIDTDGTISSYAWIKVSGPATGTIATANAATTAINNLVQGIYIFELTVTDNNGATGKDSVKVTVNAAGNLAPVANAGTDKTITLPTNTTNLTGTGTDTDGTISSYAWLKISGPATGTIATANAATTAINNLVQGLYIFELTVTDNNGATGKDSVKVTVNAAGNLAPVANAGINKTIILPINTVILTGSGTDADGSIAGYIWTKISGPLSGTIASPNAANTAINNLVQGIYQYELAVTDNNGAIGKDTVLVTVNAAANLPPVANAGTDQVITLPINSATLNGSGTDADGIIVSYSWLKISGPAAGSITTANAAITSVNSLVQGIYQYELTVTDNLGAISKDIVQLTINTAPNQPPVANAGTDQSITLPTNNTTLSGTGTDADGTISSYSWINISGPAAGLIASPNTSVSAVNNLIQGVYLFQLTVKDNKGASAKDTIKVTVNIAPNLPPVANAGTDKIIILPTNSISLNGVGTDLDGTISSYSWVKISGPAAATISSPSSGATAINNLIKGVFEFELAVTDNAGAVSKDTVRVTVNTAPNLAPLADAGVDQAINLPTNSITLTGSGSDADGTIATYTWVKIAGPATGKVISPNSASTAVNSLAEGIYEYELTVTDNDGAISKDTIRITVNAAPNLAPVANAGTNIVITLPVNSTSLTGSGTDADGTIASYVWAKISGPASVAIASPNLAVTAVNMLTQGLYEFELTVTDNDGAIGKDTVQVTVNSMLNQAPVANAGTNKLITLPINSTTLNGSGTDVDGTIANYLWLKISGPATGSITAPNAAITPVTNLVQGNYKFELTVTDNMGAISKDMMQVTVNAVPNQPPVANAGTDQSITLPTNNISLSGNGTDTDGTIAGYSWIKISGPASGLIASPNAPITTVDNLLQGIYLFQLTVKDNKGATGRDTIKVTVNIAPNLAPVANAGADKIITLPTNSISLNGVGTDLDGSINSYAWIKISGPASGTISSPNSGATAVNNLIKGVYEFEFAVTDNAGAISKDTARVTVIDVPNQAPQADAGADQVITLPTNITTISGSGTDVDGTIASYLWIKISGPVTGIITSPNSATTSLNNLDQGIYNYELTVTDNDGAISKDTIEVTVMGAPNQVPVANAGANVVIALPVNNTSLTGSGIDTDGTIASYAWVKLSGPANCVIATPNMANTSISNLTEGIYQFELTVTDNNGAFSIAIVQVTVKAAPNQLPVANAGVDKVITLPINSTNLNGSGTDTDGTITSYKWIRISGPNLGTIVLPNSANTPFTNLIQGEYQIELAVTDNNGDVSKDTVKVTVNAAQNLAPVSNAGQDITISLPTNNTTLNGSGTDPDGIIINYTWEKISGPVSGTIASPNSGITVINNLTQGVYQYELSVTDNDGGISKDTVRVTVNAAANQPPVAKAGSDITITLPTNNTNLNGSGTDPDGTIINYAWAKISGPSTGSITTANAATTAVNNLMQGLYQFELTVTDNNGAIGKDTVMVFVNAATNMAPIANAGTNTTITLPTNNTTLNGSGTDSDGTIANYAWVKISGPSFGNIVTTNTANTVINNLVQGIYQFELTVTDNNGAIGKDTVQVTVNAATLLNQLPIANAGSDVNIVLPTNNVLLKGTGNDPDGTIVTYTWKVINGPTGYSFKTPNSSESIIENLFQGVYNIEFTVVDNNGAIARDTVNITVSSPRLSNSSRVTSSNDFKVYPNPVRDIANVKITTVNKNTKLSITVADVTGKLLKSYTFVTTDINTTYIIDMANLNNSFYIITLRFDDGTILSSKVFKNASN